MTEFERAVLAILAQSREPLTWYQIERRLSDVSLQVRPNLVECLADLSGRQLVEECHGDPEAKVRYRIRDAGRSAVGSPSSSEVTSEASIVREIRYDYGNAMDPMSRVGRLIVTLTSDGAVNLSQTRGRVRRDWEARQVAGLWTRIMALLEAAEFPRRPAQPASVPPGTPSYGVSRTLANGEVETVRISSAVGPDAYRDISNVMFAIIGQMNSEMQRTPVLNEEHPLVSDVAEANEHSSQNADGEPGGER